MNISITWAPGLVQANREDYEEHLLQLERFFERGAYGERRCFDQKRLEALIVNRRQDSRA